MGLRDRVLLNGLTRGYAASVRPSFQRFVRATADPFGTQARWLQSFLEANAKSRRGERYGYGALREVRAFQDRVPISDYGSHQEDIERIAAGEANVLTTAKVRVLERTSGSTGGEKLIPYGDPLLADFQAATGPWLYSLYQRRPKLHGTTSYWSLSPATRGEERSAGGLRIGFADDTEYFGPLTRWALGQLMSVPSSVRALSPLEAWRTATLRHLLADRNLGFISVWSPTFLTLLMEALAEQLDERLAELPPRRAGEILRGLERHGAITGLALWPQLQLISCWADGHAASFLPALRRWFPGVELQPKGLLATEGVVSIPLAVDGEPLPGCVAALTSHFLEFIDLDHPQDRPRLVGELEPGGRYAPLLTTSGGLVRYRLADELSCVGRFQQTPLLRFVAKLDRISDLCGEKLSAADADRALAALPKEPVPSFALLTPQLGAPPHYRLYLESRASPPELIRAAERVEQALLNGVHYRYCRQLGQLGPVVAVPVVRGWVRYQAELMRRGQKIGDIKPSALDPGTGWAQVFDSPPR